MIKTNLTSFTSPRTHKEAIQVAEKLTQMGYEVGKIFAVCSRRQYDSKAEYHEAPIWQTPVALYITREASNDQQKFLVELNRFTEFLAEQ